MTSDITDHDHDPPVDRGTVQSTQARNDLAGQVIGGGVVQAHTIGGVYIKSESDTSYLPVTPRQIPAVPRGFVNRSCELGLLTQLVARASADLRPAVAVLSGMSGVGKSATAIRWANANLGRFSGGQLYVNFGEYRDRHGGVEVGNVLGGFLRAFGIHDSYIPADLPERAALFRSKTAGSPVLVVLDDVDHAAQVRPLLPGSTDSVVLVTSRRRLGGLLVDGAELVEMRPLDTDDGSSLMAQMLPADQARGEHDALRELASQCAGLPIALRIAGARLAVRQQLSVARLVDYLSDESRRLHRLSVTGERRVETVFDMAYGDLPAPARQVYCALGVHPGPDFGSAVVAVGAKISVDEVDEALSALTEAYLVEETGDDRYRLHDLVRLHARERAERDHTVEVREQILRRIVDWYLLGASAADQAVLGPGRWRLARPDLTRWTIHFDAPSAMAWFDAERANLIAAVRSADRQRWDEAVWQLCEALWALYHSRKHYADWIEAYELGVEAAARIGDRLVGARMRNYLARAHIELAEFRRAQRELDAAWEDAVESDDQRARAVILETYGLLDREKGSYAAAVARFDEASVINAAIGDERGVALQRYQRGDVLIRDERPGEAVEVLNDALHAFEDQHDGMAVARVRIALGRAFAALGRNDEARRALDSAVATTRERGQAVKEAQALEALVRLADREQDTNLFTSSAQRLLVIYQETGNPASKTVRQWIERRGLPEING